MQYLRGLNVEANTEEVLGVLRANRTQHATIVGEATTGYKIEAITALQRRLYQMESDQVVDLRFDLRPPVNHTKTYDTAIRALEMHERAGQVLISLSSDQIRNFVEDEWDWQDAFLRDNAKYSLTSKVLATNKGLI